MKERYLVRVKRPYGCTREQMRAYIQEAVATYSGCFDPGNAPDYEGDPLFDLDKESVSVRSLPRRKGKAIIV